MKQLALRQWVEGMQAGEESSGTKGAIQDGNRYLAVGLRHQDLDGLVSES